MNSSTHMNNIALNQNILNKGLIIGASPQQGISETPIITAEGVQVFLNGTHVMPEHEDLDNGMEIGSMIHPYAMSGMPGSSGELSYEFWATKKEYIIIVRLKLDESTFEESEQATDILALVQRNCLLPNTITDTEDNHPSIFREMLFCHFVSLFKDYEGMEELDQWTFEDDTLYSLVQLFFELKTNSKSK